MLATFGGPDYQSSGTSLPCTSSLCLVVPPHRTIKSENFSHVNVVLSYKMKISFCDSGSSHAEDALPTLRILLRTDPNDSHMNANVLTG